MVPSKACRAIRAGLVARDSVGGDGEPWPQAPLHLRVEPRREALDPPAWGDRIDPDPLGARGLEVADHEPQTPARDPQNRLGREWVGGSHGTLEGCHGRRNSDAARAKRRSCSLKGRRSTCRNQPSPS
jgi:hypothetical protein